MPALNETAPTAAVSRTIRTDKKWATEDKCRKFPRTFLFSSIVFLQSYPKMNGIRLSYELYHMQGHSSMINIISQRIP